MPASTTRAPRRARQLLVAVTALAALTGAAACAPPSPPAGGGGVEIDFGPLTIPLPPIEVRAPATTIPFGVCNVAYRPPGIQIRNATLTIPKVRIDPAKPIITVPNVRVYSIGE